MLVNDTYTMYLQ